jgi:hypothetical protein
MSFEVFKSWLQEKWPNPPDHVLARLRHTLDVFEASASPDDDEFVVVATVNMYEDHHGDQVKTGLTWGDLRLIRDYLVHQWEEDGVRPMSPLLNIPLDTFSVDRPRPIIR